MPESKIDIIFFGTPRFAVPALEALAAAPHFRIALAVTQPDKPAGRGGKITPPPVKSAAAELGIPVLQPQSLKKEGAQFLAEAKKYGPFQAGIVVAFGQILPESILSLPAAGCVNVHASLLPRWRGAAPIQRAILAGDSETGVCLMRMEAGLDTGAVFSSRRVAITQDDDAGKLHDRLALLGAELLAADLPAICSGKISAAVQSAEGVTYAEKLKAEEGAIDWNRPAGELSLLIRGFSPTPGAYCSVRGQRLKIFKASVKPVTTENALPGTVMLADNTRLEIRCGGEALAIDQLQLEGKRRMSTGEFLKGFRISAGEVFE